MIVEDYTDTRQMYATYLTFRGYEVVEASDGAEALEKAESRPPDVIVMDLALPKIDGWEATRRLKAGAATRSIPVIALTGHALAGHEEGARRAGCDAFLAKPCLPDTLASEIERVLGAGRPSAPGAKPAARRLSTERKRPR